MIVMLDLTDLELRAILTELYAANTNRSWYSMNSSRTAAKNEDKIDDMQLDFKKQVIKKVMHQLRAQGINTESRYAITYSEEIPIVKKFLLENKIKPRCPEHADWLETEGKIKGLNLVCSKKHGD